MNLEPGVFAGTCDAEGRIHLDFPLQQRAYCKRHLAGTVIDVQVREQRSTRSDRQNRALWALLQEWARPKGWTPDELKDSMLGIAFGTVERVMPITGEIRHVPAKPRSSKLNVTDFCHLIEEVLRVAAEDGVWLMAPDEYRKSKEAAARKAAKAVAA